MSEHEHLSPELVPEDELRELFRARRPDPEAFRAGVERRIDRRRAQERAAGDEPGSGAGSASPAFLRRAAALLPADPLAGAALGSAAGKWAGLKLLPALALPALVLGTAVGGFLASLGSLRRAARRAVPEAEAEPHSRHARPHWIVNLIPLGAPMILVAPGLLGSAWMVDLLVGVVLLAMLGLALGARELARAGMLSRGTLARQCSAILAVLSGNVFLWATASLGQVHAGASVGASLVVLVLGFSLCRIQTPKESQGRIASLVLVPLVALLVLGLGNPFGFTRTSPASLRAQLGGLGLDCTNLWSWDEAGALYRAMEGSGIEPPDLAQVERELERSLDPALKVHPAVWSTCADMGLVTPEHWRRLAARKSETYALDRLLTAAPGRGSRFEPWNRYRVSMLLATRSVTAEQHATVVRNVEANWPEIGSHGAPERAWMVVNLLDELGATERIEALAPAAHELLRNHWVAPGSTSFFGEPGGFTSDPVAFRTSFDDSTLAAVELMVRLGVPEGIDRFALREHLVRKGRADSTFFDRTDYLKAFERAALVLLEERIGLPHRPTLQRILDTRLLLTTVLIVVLCLVSIALVPREGALPGAASGRGALP